MYKLFMTLTILGSLTALLARGAEKVLFSEDFSNPDALSRWHKELKPDGASFQIENGQMVVTMRNCRGGAGFIEIPVPVVRKGTLDLDITINPESTKLDDAIGLTLDIYNIFTFWHDYRREWRFYSPEPTSKRIFGFDVEPVGHRGISGRNGISHGVRLHYRIRFDATKDVVEFFVNDMTDPVGSQYEVAVLGRADYAGGYLRIGAFGLATRPYKVILDNIRLEEEIESEGIVEKRDLFLVFQGMDFSRYKALKLLRDNGIEPSKIRCYDLNFRGHNLLCVNDMGYPRMASLDILRRARAILFMDAPSVPVGLHRFFLDAVHDGARLVMFGGLFSFEKGDFIGTPIGDALPVKLTTPWRVRGSVDMPLELLSETGSALEGSPVLYYYHDLKLAPKAKVLLKAGKDIPILSDIAYGKGNIVAFTGTTCGPESQKAFWNTPAWPVIFSNAVFASGRSK